MRVYLIVPYVPRFSCGSRFRNMRFVCDCSLAGEQPRDCSHPMARVSPSILLTKWEEALVITLVAMMRFRWVAVIDYLHPSAAAVDVTLP